MPWYEVLRSYLETLLVWPFAVLLLGWLFRSSIRGFLERVEWGDSNWLSFATRAANDEAKKSRVATRKRRNRRGGFFGRRARNAAVIELPDPGTRRPYRSRTDADGNALSSEERNRRLILDSWTATVHYIVTSAFKQTVSPEATYGAAALDFPRKLLTAGIVEQSWFDLFESQLAIAQEIHDGATADITNAKAFHENSNRIREDLAAVPVTYEQYKAVTGQDYNADYKPTRASATGQSSDQGAK